MNNDRFLQLFPGGSSRRQVYFGRCSARLSNNGKGEALVNVKHSLLTDILLYISYPLLAMLNSYFLILKISASVFFESTMILNVKPRGDQGELPYLLLLELTSMFIASVLHGKTAVIKVVPAVKNCLVRKDMRTRRKEQHNTEK